MHLQCNMPLTCSPSAITGPLCTMPLNLTLNTTHNRGAKANPMCFAKEIVIMHWIMDILLNEQPTWPKDWLSQASIFVLQAQNSLYTTVDSLQTAVLLSGWVFETYFGAAGCRLVNCLLLSSMLAGVDCKIMNILWLCLSSGKWTEILRSPALYSTRDRNQDWLEAKLLLA